MKINNWLSWVILLLPVFPAIDFYRKNQWLCPADEAVIIISIAAMTGVLLYLLTRLAGQLHEYSVVFAGFVGMLLHSNGHLSSAMQFFGMQVKASMSLSVQVLLLVVFIAGIHVLARLGTKKANIIGALGVMAIVLIAYPTALLFNSYERQKRFEHVDSKVDALQKTGSGSHSPNIVVLLLDGYARQDVLSEMYDFDNTPFIEALRNRGFFVADSSRSNYNATLLSMLSMFSMKHLTKSTVADVSEGDVRVMLNKQFEESLMWRIAKQEGYNVTLLTPYSFLETRDNMLENNEDGSEAYGGIRTLYLYRTSWNIVEKIGRICGIDNEQSQLLNQQKLVRKMLRKTVEVANVFSPIFMLTHIPHPHPPFIYGEGENLPWGPFAWSDGNHFTIGNNIDSKTYRRLYRSQLEIMNPMILNTIDELLQIEPPITLFVLSDHGPGSETDWENHSKTNLKERFSTLFAARMSEKEWFPYTNSVTLVNVFQPVVWRYYGYRIYKVEDKSFFSTHTEPLEMTDITREIDGSVYGTNRAMVERRNKNKKSD